ncbi:MAG: glycosyltransferase [Hellea sp.]|nr:glycosyltransferase [Hellea sp.]
MKQGGFLCDLTQSYSAVGGGVRTYLTAKRAFITSQTPYRHLLIVPGDKDRIIDYGHNITAEIKSPRVPGSPNYRLLLRSKAVIKTLNQHNPISIECLDAYNLPWAAIKYREQVGNVGLIAGYRTDFPTVYAEGLTRRFIGKGFSGRLKKRAYNYARRLYRNFDAVYALEPAMAKRLEGLGVKDVNVLPLGVDLELFNPDKRDDKWRSSIGAGKNDIVLVYAGRIDKEKQADIVVEAFLKLPKSLKASLVMLGEGNLKQSLAEKTQNEAVMFAGFISERAELAKILASSDLYVSAMAFETFGISIIEAQAAGLPVVGVAAGAMPERVPKSLGVLGPVGDADIMAKNIETLWQSGQLGAMGQRARNHVEDHFSWNRTFEHLFGHIYTKALGSDFSISQAR